jgi:SAM-dependent methyltransferase
MSPDRKASNDLLRVWASTVTGDVLSIGSSTDQDGAGGRYREYFTAARSYTTSDVRPGADLVLDVRAMPSIADERYDAVLMGGVLEHVDDIWAALSECHRVVRDGGLLLLGVPFSQPMHRTPQDFWRFTEYGVRYLLQRMFVIEDLVAIGEPLSPGTYWVRARAI